MTKLNWRDASKELPTKEDGFQQRLCIVRIKYYNGNNELQTATVYDWYNETANLDEDTGDYVGEWSEHDNDQITHWIYADEIPLPDK